MSIASFMYTGISGLRSHSDAMSVISDNIANVNTVGFKASRTNFADVLGGSINQDRVGAGSHVNGVQTLFGQGSLLGTGNATDLAIRGEGFFVLNNPNQSAVQMFSRSGQFSLDENAYLVNQDGLRVQGYLPDSTGEIVSVLGDVQVSATSLPPVATTNVSVDANLNFGDSINTDPFDIDDPAQTSDFTTAVTVYDSLGNPHQLELYFKKTADSPTPQWEVNVAVAGTEVTPPPPGERALLGTGTLDFNGDGSLASQSLASVNIPWTGANPGVVALDFGTPTGAGGSGVDGITTYNSESATSFIDQDGANSGDMGGIDITENGVITGLYTNGETRVLGQVALARFTATNTLERLGAGMFGTTYESGEPVIGAPGNGATGSLVAGSLEASNVDLAQEFVNMITVQRGFQGNSRSITTADEMLTEIVNIKR